MFIQWRYWQNQYKKISSCCSYNGLIGEIAVIKISRSCSYIGNIGDTVIKVSSCSYSGYIGEIVITKLAAVHTVDILEKEL